MTEYSHDPQMLKGVLPMLALGLLAAHGDSYGYEMVTRLQLLGLPDLTGGTLYPGLTRLEREGLIESYLAPSPAGPARKYYRITPHGQAELRHSRTQWRELCAAVGNVLGGELSSQPSATPFEVSPIASPPDAVPPPRAPVRHPATPPGGPS